MQKEIRTFIALKIKPGKEILNQLENFKYIFKDDKIRWVSADNFHLTLRFIGNATRDQLYDLADKLERVGETNQAFQLEIKGVGYFNNKGKLRVLFVGINELEPVVNLVDSIEKVVVGCGFQEELKPFRPHLTLGRIKHLESRTRFCAIVDELKDVKYQNAEISEFIIYQSILKPEGPTYKPIKTFKLK